MFCPLVTFSFSFHMLQHVDSFFTQTFPGYVQRTPCSVCNILLAMECGALHVDALDRFGRHFLIFCPKHMSGDPCSEKNFASRMWALRPSPLVIWESLRRDRSFYDVCIKGFVLNCEQLWVDLSLVDGEYSLEVKEKLKKRRWTQGLRRAWIVAVVF